MRMKRRIAILLCILLLAALLPSVSVADDRYLEINKTNFPDDHFRAWIIENLPVVYSTDIGYYMTWDKVAEITEIIPDDVDIESLRGIEHFSALETLNCFDMEELKELDVSYNLSLRHLDCDWCYQLTSLDVRNNTALEYLSCDATGIKTLDVRNNTAILVLSIYDCALTELDVSHNGALEGLYCAYNRLTELDVSHNPKLQFLSCQGNELTELNVAHNPALKELNCGFNNLTELDVTNNRELTFLNIGYDPDPEGFETYAEEVLDGGNRITSIDLSKNTKLEYFEACGVQLSSLDISNNTQLVGLAVMSNPLRTLDVSGLHNLESLYCGHNSFTALDVSHNPALVDLVCYGLQLSSLDVSCCPDIEYLDCRNNRITTLDLTDNLALWHLLCQDNRLTELDLSNNYDLNYLECGGNRIPYLDLSDIDYLEDWSVLGEQTIPEQHGSITNGRYTYDLSELIPTRYLSDVTLSDSRDSFNPSTGLVTLHAEVSSFSYMFDTQKGDMEVNVKLDFNGGELPAFDGTIVWNSADVQYKGSTPYVIANGSAQTPRFSVKDRNGNTVSRSNYTYVYRENTNAGTGYVIVTFTSQYSGTARAWFKIYLPPTTATTVENVSDGIRITWNPVEGAVGYVIYRRAWSSTTNGWTDFVRWYNVTGLSWIDGSDADHKVYAGTRYQYGVKAYFARRVDPVSGATIGGNVGDNYNLGEVGPLKTTVRITTRVLNSVTAGRKQLTAKWGASSVFTGYQVQCATNSAFTKNVKTIRITNPKTAQTVIKNLTSGKTYYVRVRSYHEFNGMTYFGEWSNVKTCKVK